MAWEDRRTPEEIAKDDAYADELRAELKQTSEVHLYLMSVKVWDITPPKTPGGKRRCDISLSYSPVPKTYIRMKFTLWEEQIETHRDTLLRYCDSRQIMVGIRDRDIEVSGQYNSVSRVVFFLDMTATIPIISEDPYAHPEQKDPDLTDEELEEIEEAPF